MAFELCLPDTYKIHPVFHVSLLKPTNPGPFPGRDSLPPPPVVVDGETEYEVESILDCRRRGRQVQYLIKWKGYSLEESSWEPAGNIHAPRLLRDFFKKFPEKQALLGIRRLPLRGGHCQGTTNILANQRIRALARMRMRAQTRANAVRNVRAPKRTRVRHA